MVGGGFGGLYAAKELSKDKRVDLTLVDRRNFHLFQPLLYQVATGALGPSEIATPLRAIFRKRRNTRVVLGQAVDVNADAREITLSDGGTVPYDTLVVSTGARFSYFGNDEWAPFAPGLKSIDDATEIRRRIFIAFEAAEREANLDRRAEWMTFVIVGGGPTGVELAGALAEIARDTLRRDFRSIHPENARIILAELNPRVLMTYPEDRSAAARKQLERLGVTVMTETKVVAVDEHSVEIEEDGNRTQDSGTNRAVGGRCRRIDVRAHGCPRGGRGDGSCGRVVVSANLSLTRPLRDLRHRRCRGYALEGRCERARRRPGRDPEREVRGQADPGPPERRAGSRSRIQCADPAICLLEPWRRGDHRQAQGSDQHSLDGPLRSAQVAFRRGCSGWASTSST